MQPDVTTSSEKRVSPRTNLTAHPDGRADTTSSSLELRFSGIFASKPAPGRRRRSYGPSRITSCHPAPADLARVDLRHRFDAALGVAHAARLRARWGRVRLGVRGRVRGVVAGEAGVLRRRDEARDRFD